MSNVINWLAVRTQTAVARLRDREGQTMAEYALILGLIAIFLILALIFLRDNIEDLFSRTGSSIRDAPNSSSS